MDKLMTVKDVADTLRISKEKVYKMAQEGKIPVIKIENQWRFREDRLHSWLETIETGLEISQKSTNQHPIASPFLKWAGGKGQLLTTYESFFPKTFKNYFEPFLGAGAVFFHLYNSGRLKDKKAFLIDSIEELIHCFQIVKDRVNDLINCLKQPLFSNDEQQFYRIRSSNPIDPIERAARTIYLNKTCFNGLYRVNSQGQFNVPFGRYTNPLICDEENLQSTHIALQGSDIVCDDFTYCLQQAAKGDFVYFDPPYQPLNKTSCFTSYTKDSFRDADQERLFDTFKKLDQIGCQVMLSNSNTPQIRQLYADFNIHEVSAKRAINSKGDRRGNIKELLIANF